MFSVCRILSTTILLIACLAGVQGKNTITCYACNSYKGTGGNCLNPASSQTDTVLCGSEGTCTTVSYYVDSTYVLSRNCDVKYSTERATCSTIEAYLSTIYAYNSFNNYKCSACNRNLCNSGIRAEITLGLIITGVLLLMLHKYLS